MAPTFPRKRPGEVLAIGEDDINEWLDRKIFEDGSEPEVYYP
jgi:hypothetical protein